MSDNPTSARQSKLAVSSDNVDRRGFLGGVGAIAAIMLTPGVALAGLAKARSTDEPVTDAQRWGMLIDTNRCVRGCGACVSACGKENGLVSYGRPQTDVQWIRKVTVRNKIHDSGSESGYIRHQISLPLMCQHCQYPPCVDVCPTGASFRRADGLVLVDRHICIGCRYCMMACPYKARSFAHEIANGQKPHAPRGKGTVEACTLCVHRIDQDPIKAPACVEACAAQGNGAMVFGDLKDPNSSISLKLKDYPSTALRADLGLYPGVRYQGI
uniref:Prokaryotic molybdopterin-containing oxidoreductase family, iron-sulfur binding subunit n=1 Tax=Candidatus Kentrum eta TaxID=2126337 RepID=A0A450UK26_9GAMM|nr:MAG: prokaryotic molybdopterin-containing oxidoreductase family, iron-sulfur binding subunit [Candidatus Kentron sp. H]VFJ92878.1 MAG: prokaryotic molybdopterin-containing oxidoreductase family, iron-sulfur binding subunit [Candidatus Kentron sp. H]VFJ99703.1 MAG: prokaryotic molybdopterin-containing oxidoreductase family, iron-sulfur binding subunit [Candidatus Kentron sp. H]